ncbi:MAG TPA: VOC family protein [Candidatus Udaeobacter sp.]|nr:VOC family protein [Candidatus Udaeobacter sp.]
MFKNSKIGKIARYGEEAAQKTGRPPGSVMTLEFTLDRVEFVALNGGPQFKFTEAISFAVNCETQDEIDYFWEKLSGDGGSTGPCGWLKDKFGLSWQVSPVVLGDMLADPDKAKAARHEGDDGNGQDRYCRLGKGRKDEGRRMNLQKLRVDG